MCKLIDILIRVYTSIYCIILTCIVDSGDYDIGSHTICANVHHRNRAEISATEKCYIKSCQGHQYREPLLDLGHRGYLRSLFMKMQSDVW